MPKPDKKKAEAALSLRVESCDYRNDGHFRCSITSPPGALRRQDRHQKMAVGYCLSSSDRAAGLHCRPTQFPDALGRVLGVGILDLCWMQMANLV